MAVMSKYGDAICKHYSTARHERSSVPEQEKQSICIGQAESMLGYLFYDPKTQTIAPTGHAFFNEDLSRKQTWTAEDEAELKQMFIEDNKFMAQQDNLFMEQQEATQRVRFHPRVTVRSPAPPIPERCSYQTRR